MTWRTRKKGTLRQKGLRFLVSASKKRLPKIPSGYVPEERFLKKHEMHEKYKERIRKKIRAMHRDLHEKDFQELYGRELKDEAFVPLETVLESFRRIGLPPDDYSLYLFGGIVRRGITHDIYGDIDTAIISNQRLPLSKEREIRAYIKAISEAAGLGFYPHTLYFYPGKKLTSLEKEILEMIKRKQDSIKIR